MTRVIELTPLPKRLQLGPMAVTLPERIALTRREQLDYSAFLEIILSDEVNRRAHRSIETRLHQASFQEICRSADFDWSASITPDRRILDAVFSLEFLDKHRHVLLVGGAGRSGQELPGPGPGLRLRQSGAHRPLHPRRRFLQEHVPSPDGQLRGAHLPLFPVSRPAHPRRPGPASAHRPAVGPPLRGCVTKPESGWSESFEHQVDHRYVNPGLAGFGQFLVVFAESSAPTQPGQCALHHPPAGQHLEVVAVRTAAHHLQQPTAGRPSPRDQLAGISAVSPDDLEPRETAQQSAQHQLGSVPVLNTGSMHHHREE